MRKKAIKIFLIICLSIFCAACQKKISTTETVTEEMENVVAQEEATREEEQETVTESEVPKKENVAELELDKKETETTATTEETTEGTEDTADTKEKAISYTSFEEKREMYAISAVNVRKGPDTSFEIVSHLKGQDKVEVTGQADNGWFQIMVDNTNAYVSNKYLSEQPVEAKEADIQSKKKSKNASGGVIMVGDSRCVQMQAAVSGGGCAWVCENSKGYDWFNETAMPRVDAAVTNGTRIVINLGVNDPGNVRKYAELVNAKAAEWSQKGATVYFVSVNPVWENPYTTEEQVTTFNSTIPSLLSPGIGWIDTHSWLVTNGYRLVDGLHYDDPTYVNIYNVIMGSI